MKIKQIVFMADFLTMRYFMLVLAADTGKIRLRRRVRHSERNLLESLRLPYTFRSDSRLIDLARPI